MWHSEDETESVTFGEFKRRAEIQAIHFHLKGLRPEDRVILIMPQGIELMLAFVGAMLLGAIPAILAYPNFKVDPEKYRLGLEGVSANLKAHMIVLDKMFPQELLKHLTLTHETQIVINTEDNDILNTTFTHFIPQRNDLAFIQHSAGTTGLQKGVALSHAAVLQQLEHLGNKLKINRQDRIYSWLPLYHDMGLIACFILPLVFNLPIVMQSPTEWVMQPNTMLQLISKYKCTLAWIPNFALQFLARRINKEERTTYNLSTLRCLINCSEPVRAQSMDEFITAYSQSQLQPNVLQSSYAMAENVFAVTQSSIDAPVQRICIKATTFRNNHLAHPVNAGTNDTITFVSSGHCLQNNKIKIVSAEGRPLPDGSVGEILIASDSLFDGYYNRPDLSDKVLKDGWYWSGDIGFLINEELYVVGRKKDIIIVAGKNIHPHDIEEIICSHPMVYDGRAIAFGVFNPDLGTEDIIVIAEVNKEEYLSNATEIEKFARNAIATEMGITVRSIYIKPPRWIIKSTAGKPSRAATKSKLLADHPELQEK
jgi:acyl-CoA synthetase (AMP-forming)/AMP-acid ligase II